MLRVGLIDCDPLPVKVSNIYGDYPKMFADLFALATNHISWQVYDATQQQLPFDLKACDAYLITGSHFGVQDEHPWIQTLNNFVLQLWQEKIKTIGICFGHQIIAKAMGAQVGRAPIGWRMGVVKTSIKEQKPWMVPWQSNFQVCVSHQDQVLSLPSNGLNLATTTSCPYAILQYGNTFLSLQGHPEFNKTYTRFLIDKRRHLFKEAVFEDFIESLSLKTDTELLANWLTRFVALK